ncbi:MAG TPA: hypothetical protein VKB35_12245 [Ktedonobacteraceae bacterium]|nr:hypothetical protein [Ktedonobacteraceae bacterium]
MLALTTILADGVTIKIGNDIWTFGLNIIIYVVIAAIVGLVAEAIVGWRLPFGIIGAIIAALVGIWLMTQVIIISGVGDIYLGTNPAVPIVRALIGAIILVALWHLITYPLYRRRQRYYYRRA